MTYLNRFLVEEETQFECDGIYEEDSSTYSTDVHLRRVMNRMSNKLSDSITVHILEAAEFDERQVFTNRAAYKLHPNLKLTVTRLGSERIECVERNEYKKFIREGLGLNYKYQFKECLSKNIRYAHVFFFYKFKPKRRRNEI